MAIKITTSSMKTKTRHFRNGSADASESGGSSSSPSPPRSPRRHSFSHSRPLLRTKSRREGFSAGVLLRGRIRNFVVLPFLYISGLLMCVGPFTGLMGHPPPPGSVYRSHELFHKLWPDIESDNSTAIELSNVWKYKRTKEQKPCLNTTIAGHHFGVNQESPGPSGYLIVEANGGLNQQRSSICNAVAVAKLLNAVLVIPHFELHRVWKDPSQFADIYDEDHFIATLEGHVKVVSELPEELMERHTNISNVPYFRIQAWAPASYYLSEVYPVLRAQGVIRIVQFANRLAMHVPPHIQRLRCFANYEALRFSTSISSLAHKLVNRMIEKSSRTDGKYVSIHLRFDEDMLAFSCCKYGGGEDEKTRMDSIRAHVWKKKFNQKNHVPTSGQNRINGKCPLTPLEVGMMLRGMGFDNNTTIYLASGKIYQPDRHLAPLLKMFPLIYSKDSLATPEELAPLEGYSSRLAALDYIVSLYSEVFVTTQGGNFPHFLMGHRRFLFDGHAKTIQPDKPKLVVLLEDMNISWESFSDHMKAMLAESDRKGLMVPRVRKINRKTSIYTFPLPECRCLQKSHNSTLELIRNPQVLDYRLNSTR